MGAISGWGGRVQVNIAGSSVNTGTAMPVSRWTVNDRADGIDCTTMEHAGYADYVSSVNDYDVSFECFYDTTLNPFLATPNLNPGVSAGTTPTTPVYLTVTLSLDRTSATRTWLFTRLLVTDVSMDSEVRGVIRYTVQGKATKGVTFAAGTTPTLLTGLSLGAPPQNQTPQTSPG